MASNYEDFWTNSSFAFVGHSAKKPFPTLSYTELRQQGKKVFAVDPSVDQIEGDRTYPDLASLPEKVEAVVLELPKEETEDWVRRAADEALKATGIDAVPSLLDGLKVGNPAIRREAARALGLVKPPATRAIPALLAALNDPGDGVRTWAAKSLFEIDREAHRPFLALVDSRESEPSREVLAHILQHSFSIVRPKYPSIELVSL